MNRDQPAGFAHHLRERRRQGTIVVQPRMGFADPRRMGAGLLAVRDARAATVGTITLDSYTRTGDLRALRKAVRTGAALNGYPICTHPAAVTRRLLDDVAAPHFPVQVRHGSALPSGIVDRLLAVGLDATEGGPVSYCLPYGRVPLDAAIDDWSRACDRLAAAATPERPSHLESFGGCLLGQLCPPSLLLAVTVLEAIFFRWHGVPSISLSYAQGTSFTQDVEALTALRRLAADYLPGVDIHLVLYTYMGVFPRSTDGARALLYESARLAVHGGADRLIVKTIAEHRRIPSIHDNVEALEHAHQAVRRERHAAVRPVPVDDSGILAEACALVNAVLSLSEDPRRALREAFRRGLLDVPYCLHPDNHGRTRSRIDAQGRLRWACTGSMPVPRPVGGEAGVSAGELTKMLQHVANRFDATAATAGSRNLHLVTPS